MKTDTTRTRTAYGRGRASGINVEPRVDSAGALVDVEAWTRLHLVVINLPREEAILLAQHLMDAVDELDAALQPARKAG